MCKLKRLFAISFLTVLLSIVICPATVLAVGVTTEEEDNKTEGGSETAGDGSPVADTTLDSGSAIEDILLGERYQGAISSISWFTTRIDSITVMLISGAAFFIISAAFLKNVCAGVYCSNSHFFDKVDEAHKKAEAMSLSTVKGYFGGGQFQNTTVGGFRDFLLVLIPNFKDWTEFAEADIEPKQYFMKSIPQMLFAVMIGIFIYNGFYRDTAVKVGQFGSEAFTRVMAAASPIELLDKISATTGRPDFITDDSIDPAGKLANGITKDAYSAIITRYSDMTSTSQKTKIASTVEPWVIDFVNTQCLDYLRNEDGNSWKYSYDVKLTTARIDKEPAESDNQVQILYVTSDPAHTLWGLSTVKGDADPRYLAVKVTFTKVAFDGKGSSGSSIDGSSNAGDVSNSTNEWSDTPAEITLSLTPNADGSYSGTYPESADGYKLPMKIASGSDIVVGSGLTLTVESSTKGAKLTYKGSVPASVQANKNSFYAIKDKKKYVINFTVVSSIAN